MAVNDPEVLERLNTFLKATEEVSYEGVPIALSSKINLHTLMRTRKNFLPPLRARVVSSLRGWLVFAYRCAQGIFWQQRAQKMTTTCAKIAKHKLLVVTDAGGHTTNHVISLLSEFDKDEVVVVETCRPPPAEIWKDFPNYLNFHKLLALHRPARLPLYASYFRRITGLAKDLRPEEASFLFPEICLSLHAVDCFNDCLDTLQPTGVLMIDCNHRNTYVATQCALERDIPTYVSQHGDPAVLVDHLPVPTKQLFVWGPKSRDKYIEGGVLPEIIVIAGNPHLDEVFSHFIPNRPMLRERVNKKYNLDGDLRTLTYLSSGTIQGGDLTYGESETLLQCVCAAARLPVNVIVKLHPTADDLEFHERCVEKNGLSGKITFLQSEDIRTVLAATDIAVVYHTTAGIEAISFGIPTIMLNVIPELDAKGVTTYADDTIECVSQEGFLDTVNQLASDDNIFLAERDRTLNARQNHVANSEEFNSSRFIRDYLRSSASQNK